jgi:hypothetical protein
LVGFIVVVNCPRDAEGITAVETTVGAEKTKCYPSLVDPRWRITFKSSDVY